MEPSVRPIRGVEGNGDDIRPACAKFCLMCHNLCHVVSARQSGKVAQEDEEQGTAVAPIVGKRGRAAV